MLQESQLRAENCLKFISLLQGPCEDLKAAEPSAIPALLPRLLTTIRVIWNNSEHYKSRERLNGLLRRVSRERGTEGEEEREEGREGEAERGRRMWRGEEGGEEEEAGREGGGGRGGGRGGRERKREKKGKEGER